ncbi:MAG: ATP-binding protein [Chloroflexi bacterium]|nr:MAG: ATP-binding protein [Chloroflexota bacterium]
MPVDLSGALRVAIDSRLAEADRKKAKGDVDEACRLYRECAALMRQYAEETPFPKISEQRQHVALVYEERASGLLPQKESGAEYSHGDADNTLLKGEVSQLIHRSSITWEDIGGLEETKEQLKLAYGIEIAQKPDRVRVKGWKTILFYGPPGTGKTLLAAATSNGLEATFFNVSLSGILSKYFGESSKLISALYSEARRLAPSVVYIDEIEALSTQRSGDETGAERRVTSSLLTELDGIVGKSDSRYVLTIGSTNLPWLLDKAILSRFEKKIFVPLPDEKARQNILRIHLEHQGIDSNVSYSELAAMTEGYSGRELERISREVISQMIRELNPQIPELVSRGFNAIRSYKLKLRPVTRKDFVTVLTNSRPEVTTSDLQRFADWQESVG